MSYHVMNICRICVHNLFQCLAWCWFLIRIGMKLEGPRRFWCLRSPDQWNSVSKSDALAEEGERLPAWRCLQVAWVAIIGFESVWAVVLFAIRYVAICCMFPYMYRFVTVTVRPHFLSRFVCGVPLPYTLVEGLDLGINKNGYYLLIILKSIAFSIKANNL